LTIDLRQLSLEVPTSCSGCGACCQVTPLPPFAPGEAAARGVPAEWWEAVVARETADQQFEVRPCVWYDAAAATCQHYELRPTACRDFALGGTACQQARIRLRFPAQDGG
jgi:Fe-S-cluster containining protein